MAIRLGQVVPDFSADSTQGPLNWHEYIAGSWVVLVSHPADFTPVCTTELGTLASLAGDFKARGFKLACLSCDSAESHKGWIPDIESQKWAGGSKVEFPIIADEKRNIADAYGMIDPAAKDAAGMPLTCRAVFIIKPDKTLAASILYPASTGRDFSEILRVVDSLQMTVSHKVATPVNWRRGEKCMVVPAVSTDQARELFKETGGVDILPVPSGKEYLRMTNDPKHS